MEICLQGNAQPLQELGGQAWCLVSVMPHSVDLPFCHKLPFADIVIWFQGNAQPLQELGGQALVPDMMYSTLDIFNPHNAKLTSAAAAGQPACFSMSAHMFL